jgi:hypothetical protein
MYRKSIQGSMVLNQLILDENNIAFHPMMGDSYQLNDLGVFILKQLQASQTSEEIITMLGQKYNISLKELYIDVEDFIRKLKIHGLY